eukprot:22901-Prorocentrum_lima.AAC.1
MAAQAFSADVGEAAGAAGAGRTSSQAVPGGIQGSFPGFWAPLFGPPSRPGGPPRTVWVPAGRLLAGSAAEAAAAAAVEAADPW